MRTGTSRTVAVLVGAALLLTGCDGSDNNEPTDNATPAPPTTGTPEPDPQTLDGDAAAELYVAWREAVYALPPTEPEAVDLEAAAEKVVVPGSAAANWVTEELRLAGDRGVITRGTVHAEAIAPVQVAGDRATVAICSSTDARITDVATGDPVSDEAIDTTYTRFEADYRRAGDSWLVEGADRSSERACVPPSVEGDITARWETFTEAWYERDRQGGGDDLGRLTEVVTEEFASTLRGLPARDPVPDPDPFTDFELIAATRTTATGHACRSGGLQTIEWMLVDGQWQVDFAGREGEESTPCP
jgi:hypothetical protein